MVSSAELIEDFDFSEALKLYRIIIDYYKKQIIDYKLQAKLHEIAELYLRIADIYREKMGDFQLEKKNIINSIKFLKQESNLLKQFGETRKWAQNFQNIAELFVKLSDFKNAIKHYERVIEISKIHNYLDLLSFSYRQIGSCYKEVDDHAKFRNTVLDGVEYFSNLASHFEEKNDNETECKIRKCCIEKGFFACYECSIYEECEILKTQEDPHGDSSIQNFQGIKKMGIDAWVKKGKRYWFGSEVDD